VSTVPLALPGAIAELEGPETHDEWAASELVSRSKPVPSCEGEAGDPAVEFVNDEILAQKHLLH
jgi:hypothetical protein